MGVHDLVLNYLRVRPSLLRYLLYLGKLCEVGHHKLYR